MQRFNHGKPMNDELRMKIEEHFNHKWVYDKNQALRIKKDLEMFNQIPDEIKDKILYKFLFQKFLYAFKEMF
jgi:predicted glycosyltransferase